MGTESFPPEQLEELVRATEEEPGTEEPGTEEQPDGVVDTEVPPITGTAGEVPGPTGEQRCAEDSASYFSEFFFGFASGLFFDNWSRSRKAGKGQTQKLDASDFWAIPEKDHVEEISKRFEKLYTEEGRSLKGSLFQLGKRKLILAGCFRLIVSGCMVAIPLILQELLVVLQSPNPDFGKAYGWACGLGAAMFFRALFENRSYWLTGRAGWQMRAAVTSAVYRKSLRLSNAARQSKTLGEIVNYMQLDAHKIALCTDQLNALWDGPLQVVAFTIVLWFILGWATFVGLVVTFLSIPIMSFAVMRIAKLDRKAMIAADERVKSTNEAIQSMLGVKVSCWEDALTDVVQRIRDLEVSYLHSSVAMRAIMASIMSSTPAFSSVCALAAYTLAEAGPVTPAILFSALQAFNFLRSPMMFLPLALTQTTQANVSARRVEGFLRLDEIEDLQREYLKDGEFAVVITDATFSWIRKKQEPNDDNNDLAKDNNSDSVKDSNNAPEKDNSASSYVQKPVLSNVNLKIRHGELIAVVGRVGSGKSALLNAILGEIHLLEGSISVYSQIAAYAAQTSWILNASIRDNIIFGADFDRDRYEKVISACQLERDLQLFSHRDLTEIGERGTSLSGGQKQRIATARAAYWANLSNGFVILDDILSSLDPEVGARLFTECVCDFLAGTTRIVVTNQLENLDKFDRIIVIDNNTIDDIGTYDELVSKDNRFGKLLSRFGGSTASMGSFADRTTDDTNGAKKSSQKKKQYQSMGDKDGPQTSIMREEEREIGAVKAGVYTSYINAGGGYITASFVLLMFLLMQGAFFINTIWITWWTEDAAKGYPSPSKTLEYYLIGYFLTAVLLLLTALARTLSIYYFGIRATSFMHRTAFQSVIHATMLFFETTPTGRILQRFSRDVRELDSDLPENLQMFIFTFLFVLFAIVLVCVLTPLFIAFVVPFALVLLFFLHLYRPVMRDAKRLGAIALSPVYAQFSETLNGLSSVRAFNAVDRFVSKESRLINEATRLSMYAAKLCERWISMRVEIFGAASVLVASCLAVQAVDSGVMNASDAGLSISYANMISQMATTLVRTFATVEASMNSVERVSYVISNTPQEKWRDEDYAGNEGFVKDVPETWPQGSIQCTSLSLRYRENAPIVLNNLTFEIKAKEKIGIVGRSGSGKSSVFMALLRIVEPVAGSKILFDGIDVTQVRLDVLRSRIGVAPQFPVLFSGTVRYNVDPFQQFDDAAIWTALEGVGLKPSIPSLDDVVAESGENFSQGERQLLSLSRLLLKRPNLVLLDEATASLDTEGDELVQRSIRETFKESTMLVIAHRLRTIIMSDRILVLAPGGALAEFDRPDVLLNNPESQLSLAVAEMGEKQGQMLRQASMNLRQQL